MTKEDLQKLLNQAATKLQEKTAISIQALVDTTNAEVNRVLSSVYQILEKDIQPEQK